MRIGVGSFLNLIAVKGGGTITGARFNYILLDLGSLGRTEKLLGLIEIKRGFGRFDFIVGRELIVDFKKQTDFFIDRNLKRIFLTERLIIIFMYLRVSQFDILFFGRGRGPRRLQGLISRFFNIGFFGRSNRGKSPGSIMQYPDSDPDIDIF